MWTWTTSISIIKWILVTMTLSMIGLSQASAAAGAQSFFSIMATHVSHEGDGISAQALGFLAVDSTAGTDNIKVSIIGSVNGAAPVGAGSFTLKNDGSLLVTTRNGVIGSQVVFRVLPGSSDLAELVFLRTNSDDAKNYWSLKNKNELQLQSNHKPAALESVYSCDGGKYLVKSTSGLSQSSLDKIENSCLSVRLSIVPEKQ